jgi:hypothetical protein
MSAIQGYGFTVTPLGNLPLLPSAGQSPAAWTQNAVFPSAEVSITATGQSIVLQVFAGKTQDDANLNAMIFGNKNAGNW